MVARRPSRRADGSVPGSAASPSVLERLAAVRRLQTAARRRRQLRIVGAKRVARRTRSALPSASWQWSSRSAEGVARSTRDSRLSTSLPLRCASSPLSRRSPTSRAVTRLRPVGASRRAPRAGTSARDPRFCAPAFLPRSPYDATWHKPPSSSSGPSTPVPASLIVNQRWLGRSGGSHLHRACWASCGGHRVGSGACRGRVRRARCFCD